MALPPLSLAQQAPGIVVMANWASGREGQSGVLRVDQPQFPLTSVAGETNQGKRMRQRKIKVFGEERKTETEAVETEKIHPENSLNRFLGGSLTGYHSP